MEPTPIKVRGRREKPPVQNNNNTAEGHQKKPKGSTAGEQIDDTNKSTRGSSRLEKLPVELLEKILLYSLNLNLPRASPSLAGALSSERVYRILILLAYWDDYDYNLEENLDPINHGGIVSKGHITELRPRPYEDNILRILRPLERGYVPLTFHEKKMLQSAILKCRWCTIQRINRQIPELLKLIITRRWINIGLKEGSENPLLSGQGKRDDQGVKYFTGTKEVYPLSENVELFLVLDIKYPEWVRITVFTIDKASQGGTKTASRLFPLLTVKEFPTSLFRGHGKDLQHGDQKNKGFNKDDIEFLKTLHSAGGFNGTSLLTKLEAEDITYSRPALLQGIHTAIVTNDLHAINVLLNLDEYLFLSSEGHGDEDSNNDGDDEDRSDTDKPPLPLYKIPSDFFRLAARMGLRKLKDPKTYDPDANFGFAMPDDGMELLSELILASVESIPYDDPIITQYGMQVDGELGEWLLELMLDLPNFIYLAERNPKKECLFYMGRYNQDIDTATRFAELTGLGLDSRDRMSMFC